MRDDPAPQISPVPPHGPDDPAGDRADDRQSRNRRTGWEIGIVLALSLGQSAVYAVISLIAKLTAGRPLAGQQVTVNGSLSPRPYLDLTYQLVGIVFTLAPVLLVIWLLAGSHGSLTEAARRIGLTWPARSGDRGRPAGRDLAQGCFLAAVIGLPGLGLYYLGRQLGITAEVVAADLGTYWWTAPVLVLQAVKNAVLEEVIVVAYLLTRLRGMGWPLWAMIAASALLRGSYHLYQGFGPFLGNAVMGVVFALWFRRNGRVLPLVIAHTVLDVVAFVGYQFVVR